MNILLIYPPNENQAVYSKNFRRIKGADTAVYPPLGLMYLQGLIKKERLDDNIKMIDLTLPGSDSFDLNNYLKEFKPDVVGLTAYTLCFYDVLSVCKIIKNVDKNIKTVLGGPHIELYPEETIAHEEIDYIIFGDGEYPFLNLVNTIENKGNLSEVESLYYKDRSGKVIKNKRAAVNKNLDLIPFPCRDDIDFSNSFNPYFKEKRFATICSSRGCPFQCTFCDVTDKIFRARTISNVVDEIEYLINNFNVKSFFFVDDMFNITSKMVIKFCDEISRRNLKISWIFRGRVDQVTETMLEKCKKNGCIHIIYGVEDFTDEGLNLIKKKITTSQVISVINMTHKYKIKTTANFIIGFPFHKSRSDILKINDFLQKFAIDNIQVGILIPFPGSKIFADGVEQKVIDELRWINYVKKPTKVFEVPLWEEHLALDELTELYEYIIKSFFLSPRILLKKVLEIKSWHQFKKYFQIGMVMLKMGKK